VNSTSQITVKLSSPGTGKIPVHWDFSANGQFKPLSLGTKVDRGIIINNKIVTGTNKTAD